MATIVGCVVMLVVALAAQPRERAARISLELFTDQGFGVDDSHRWYQMLTELGVASLQIRGEAPGDEIGIHTVGKRDAPTYEVTGRITASNVLQLPGGKFTLQRFGPIEAVAQESGRSKDPTESSASGSDSA